MTSYASQEPKDQELLDLCSAYLTSPRMGQRTEKGEVAPDHRKVSLHLQVPQLPRWRQGHQGNTQAEILSPLCNGAFLRCLAGALRKNFSQAPVSWEL